MLIFRSLLVIGSLMTVSFPAFPCSPIFPEEFLTEPETDDTTPPAAPVVKSLKIERSRYAAPGKGDCGELGWLRFTFLPPSDGETYDDLGIEFSMESDDDPIGFPDYPVAVENNQIILPFSDNPEEDINIIVSLNAVDKASNRSSLTEISIESTGEGCQIARHGKQSNMLFLLISLFKI